MYLIKSPESLNRINNFLSNTNFCVINLFEISPKFCHLCTHKISLFWVCTVQFQAFLDNKFQIPIFKIQHHSYEIDFQACRNFISYLYVEVRLGCISIVLITIGCKNGENEGSLNPRHTYLKVPLRHLRS